MAKDAGVYMILNVITNDRYVGSTPRSFKTRWVEHKSRLRKNKHGTPALQSAWNRYGVDAFQLVPLEITNSCLEREQYWMDIFRANGLTLYNTCQNAADHKGMVMPEDGVLRAVENSKKTRENWTPEFRQALSDKCAASWGDKRRERKRHEAKTEWSENRDKMLKNRIYYGPYDFVSPSGELFHVEHLSDFCKEHGLDPSAMVKIHKGGYGRKTYKGWRKA